jgi:hypothetical protein
MKNVILWNYERGTWQYDLFCLLIIAFIFLTPKTWFAGKEKDPIPRPLAMVEVRDFPSNDNKLKMRTENLSDKQTAAISKRQIR